MLLFIYVAEELYEATALCHHEDFEAHIIAHGLHQGARHWDHLSLVMIILLSIVSQIIETHFV